MIKAHRLVALLLWLGLGPLQAQRVDLSPARWPAGELKRFDSLTIHWRHSIPLAEGQKGMIVATSGAAAVRAGFEALKQGGSAIDAARVLVPAAEGGR